MKINLKKNQWTQKRQKYNTKAKNQSLAKINRTEKLLVRLTKKKEKSHRNNNQNERRECNAR